MNLHDDFLPGRAQNGNLYVIILAHLPKAARGTGERNGGDLPQKPPKNTGVHHFNGHSAFFHISKFCTHFDFAF